MLTNIILPGDVMDRLKDLPDESIQCVVTSPPYWKMRSYLPDDDPLKHLEIGLEPSLNDYIYRIVDVFSQIWRVLKDNGTVWINIGDSYANKNIGSTIKRQDLIGLPWRIAFALQDYGWHLRSEIIWHRLNAMPEGKVKRQEKAHEQLFLLTKSEKYYYNADAIRTPLKNKTLTTFGTRHKPQKNDSIGSVKSDNWSRSLEERKPRINEDGKITGANIRSVWGIAASTFHNPLHLAVMPEKLVEPCILAGSKPGDTILDPFCGSGTVPVVAIKNERSYIGVELNEEYVKLAQQRIDAEVVSCP